MLKKIAKNLQLSIIFLMLVLLSGCDKNFIKPTYKIGFSQCVASDHWRAVMLKEMRRELSFHKDVDFVYEEAGGSSEVQVAQVKKLLAQNIDLLIISPNEAEPLTDVVEEAYDRGIPVVIIDRGISSKKYTAYVGADNYEVGKIAGNYLASSLNGVGDVVEILGLPRSTPAIQRDKGFSDALAAHPQINIVQKVAGNWLKSEANIATQENIDDIVLADAIFAHNDQMALGVYDALAAYDKAIPKLIGVDANSGQGNGLEAITKGIFEASIFYPTGGKEAIRTSLAILKKQPFKRHNTLQTVVVDAANVQLMQMQEHKMDEQQDDIERQQKMLDEQLKVYRGQQFTLNILVASLVFAVVFGAIAFYSLTENWKNNKRIEAQHKVLIENERKLRELTEKASEAKEAKMNFFTNISHEFRTPITLMLLPIAELLKDKQLPADAHRKVALIDKSANRVLKMVNELIDFRKIEFDKMRLSVANVDISKAVQDTVQAFADVAAKKNIDLRIKTSSKSLYANLDMQLFDKVLFNLLANAFKFTPEYGHVYVQLAKENDELTILVEDSGLGISPADIAHVFEPFYQGKATGGNGSGLGLALCKEIVELHGGAIAVTSEENKGSIFSVTIPVVETAKVATATYQVSEDLAKTYTANILTNTVASQPEVSGKNAAKDKSVLIIEDNEDMRTFLQEQLGKTYEIFTAANGKEGFETAVKKVPDLIISDVLMPIADGVTTTKRLKNDLRTSHIPVVLLTARSSQEQRVEGMDAMADAYLTKPFNLEVLQAMANNIISNRDLLRQKYTSQLPLVSGKEIGKLDKKFLNDFDAIIEENLSVESFSVEDISEQIGLSRVQLYRKVKALLNCSVAEYMLNRRLQKAKYLLLNEPDLSIAEITFKTGFSSPNYFSTVFKAKYECTPSDFRKSA